MTADELLDPCPACGRGTCEACRCNDEAGAFVVCQHCADELVDRGLAQPE